MNVQFYEKLLTNLIKANKEYKLKLAIKAGYKTVEEYKEALELAIGNSDVENEDPKEEVIKKPIIHNVILSDASASMGFGSGKYESTESGVRSELEKVNSTDEVVILHSLYEFVDIRKGVICQYKDQESPTPSFNGATGGNTPLWKSIVELLNIFKSVPKTEKVLVKVFTDGGNNVKSEYKRQCRELIEDLNNQNFTITFVATPSDMQYIISDMNLDESNTLEVENTSEGFEKAYEATLDSTILYSKKVVRGESVKSGFYKSFKK